MNPAQDPGTTLPNTALSRRPPVRKKVFAPMLLIVLFCTVLVQLPMAIADRTSGYDFIDPIIDIRGILVESFVREPDDEKMLRAAIAGMIESLGDEHTIFVPPAKVRDFNKDLRGTYVGIGSEVNIIDDYLTIVSPMDDSPSLESGIRAGDVVLEIEGESTYKLPVQDCIDKLLGKPNTKVTIKVRHLDDEEEFITITRRRITARTVKGLVRNGKDWHHCVDPENNINYVRVTQFNGSTIRELRHTLDELVEGGMQGLILDLRDNPGGALPAAIEMADMFLTEGDILEIRPRKGRKRTWSSHRLGTLPDFPIIVLVNGSSASASEIVSGALQDNDRAKVLGTRSFGKGSVQEVRELDFNRGTLKYTNAYYHLPSGRNLNRDPDSEETLWGVDPNPGLVIPETDEAYVERVLARRPFEVIKGFDETLATCLDIDWIQENIKDNQLTTAIEVLAKRISDDEWIEVTDIDPAVAAIDLELKRWTQARSRMMRQLEQIDERIQSRRNMAEVTGREPLLPEDVELIAGTITLRDKDGNVVGEYRIDGGDLELALNSVQLTPLKQEE